jgi:hypothetical protein
MLFLYLVTVEILLLFKQKLARFLRNGANLLRKLVKRSYY